MVMHAVAKDINIAVDLVSLARVVELLNANQSQMTVYVMKAALKDLWVLCSNHRPEASTCPETVHRIPRPMSHKPANSAVFASVLKTPMSAT